MPLNKLLSIQLKKVFGEKDVPSSLKDLIEFVNDSYNNFEKDRIMLERSLEISSKELKEAYSEIKAFLEYFPDHIYRISYDGTIIEFRVGNNKEFLPDWKNAVGNSIFDAYEENVSKQFAKSVENVIKNNKIVNFEYSLKNNADRSYFEARLIPFLNEEIFIIVRNITDKYVAQNFLKESEEKYKTLVENTSDVVFEATYEGKFLYVSPNCYNIVGFTQEELIGTSIFQYVHPDDLAAVIKEFSSSIQEMRKGSIILRSRHKNGEWKWFDAVGKPYTTASNEIKAVITAQDITEKRKAEEESLRMAKLDSLSILAGGIAHDFNNMLTTILGNLYLIQQYDGKDEKTYKKNVKDLETAVNKATNLTQQLLTFSKGGSPVRETASIKDLLIESTNFALRGSNINCELIMTEDLLNVEVDTGQIGQVIQNLVINAKQAMPEGGNIRLTAKNVKKDEFNNNKLSAGDYIEITLKDNGIGIPDNYISKIFDPYFTTKEEGSGLGLATCYSIVKKHNGVIEVESEVGVGTIFRIFLPATNHEVINSSQVQVSTFKGEGKVLIMDDEIGIRDILSHVFKDLGFETDQASNGNEAIKKCENILSEGENYVLAVLDLTIPGGMGGKEVVGKLLEIDPNLKTIVSSGYSNNEVMAKHKEYGFNGYIKKPYNLATFAETIKKVLND